MSIINERIRDRRTQLGLTLAEVAGALGVKEATAQRYESGAIKHIKHETIVELGRILHCSPSYLMGWEERPDNYPENLMPVSRSRTVPLIGTIACGKPILAVEDASEEIAIPDFVHADFALRCKGDSMINARIFDGDVVYIRRQDSVENGDIAAVIVGEEATLKKVYYQPGERLILRACNPMYSDLEYFGPELNSVKILGRAVFFLSAVRG